MQDHRFDIDIRNVDRLEPDDEPVQPVLHITCHGWRSEVEERFTGPDGNVLAAEEIDVVFRFQAPTTEAGATGVVSLADRATGAFILEASTPASPIQNFVDAVERYGERTDHDDCYVLTLETERTSTTYEKQVFLVYAQDGTLLRHRSIIPNGIEI